MSSYVLSLFALRKMNQKHLPENCPFQQYPNVSYCENSLSNPQVQNVYLAQPNNTTYSRKSL